jgi:hypothetical protein
VNVVIKTGSNQFHGSAFEFFRNSVLNANDFFYNRNNPASATTKQILNRNQFGGALGGPVIKNKSSVSVATRKPASGKGGGKGKRGGGPETFTKVQQPFLVTIRYYPGTANPSQSPISSSGVLLYTGPLVSRFAGAIS